MTLRHYAFSRQLSEDVYVFVLWRYVAVQIWHVKELFVPGIVASTINKVSDRTMYCGHMHRITTWTMLPKESKVWSIWSPLFNSNKFFQL